MPTAGPAANRQQERKSAIGSSVSSKQIARAAVNQRLVKFSTLVGDYTGYVIGQDDFHWIVATVPQSGGVHQTTLIHKGSAAVVTITDQVLDEQPEAIVESIRSAGESFWSFCRSAYSL